MLKFSVANAKTKKLAELPELQSYLCGKRKVYSLDMLSGWSCPGALDCLAKVHVVDGKRWLSDGLHTKFRCFSASQEVAYTNVYNLRNANFRAINLARGEKQICELILACLPKNAGVVRYHVAGDFFKKAYLKGAILAAKQRPDVLFYTYTKSIRILCDIPMLCPERGIIESNFLVTASLGGRYDNLISQLGLRTAKVVYSEAEAWDLPIDHNDSHAATPGGDFALLLHGIQPKGTPAARALQQLKGQGSYTRT